MISRIRFMAASTAASLAVAATRAPAPAKMMSSAMLLVQYKTPSDTNAFDTYYTQTHAPKAKKLPGLRDYQLSSGAIETPDGKPSATYYLVAMLTFDSVDAIKAALASDQGKIVVGDLKNFAGAGLDITMYGLKSA